MLGVSFDCTSSSHYLSDEVRGVIDKLDVFVPPSSVTVMGIAGVVIGYIFIENSEIEPGRCVRIIASKSNERKKTHYGVREGASVAITSIGNVTAKCITVDTL
jgi:hypothetical protein